MSPNNNARLATIQSLVLVILRIAIGWHFLYEGIVKLTSPGWSSAAFLSESKWLFANFFHWIVAHPAALQLVDAMNISGLILIGLGLIFGLLTRFASIAGIALLLLYYIANPPLAGFGNSMGAEGNYLVIDKNLLEMIVLILLAVLPPTFISLDRLLTAIRYRKKTVTVKHNSSRVIRSASGSTQVVRRELLKNMILLPVMGGFIFAYLKKRGRKVLKKKTC